ncbi:MAG: protein-tyrosine-phosphatase [Paracoccaceae bacterium]|jgi:arsenate reductase
MCVRLISRRRWISSATRCYSIDPDETAAFTQFLLSDFRRGLPEVFAPMTRETSYNSCALSALFIYSGNSVRSLLAEVLLRDAAPGQFVTYWAATQPAASEPNPYVLRSLQRSGHDVIGLASKPVSQMQAPDALIFDVVFTVCDDPANEKCLSWPGQPMSAHWGVKDQAKAAQAHWARGLQRRLSCPAKPCRRVSGAVL